MTAQARNSDSMWRVISRLLLWLPLPVLAAAAVRNAVVIPHDTAEYVAHTVTRPPIYPLFLDVTQFLFRSHFIGGTAVLQALLAVASAWRLGRTIATRFTMPRATALFEYLLLVPQLTLVPSISSDSLTYDLFLVMSASGIGAIYAPSSPRILRTVALTMLAILTRAQFLFVLPVLALGVALAYRFARPKLPRLVAVYALAIIASGVAFHKTYNYAFNRRFVTVPYTGIQLLTMNAYLMHEADVALFADPDDHRYASNLYQTAARQGLLYETKPVGDPTTHHLFEQYAPLCLDVIVGSWAEQFTPHRFSRELQSRSLTPEELVALDKYTLHISFVLLRHKAAAYLALIAKCWNQYEGLFGLFGVTLFAVALERWIKTRDPAWAVLGFAFLLWAANNLLVCMVEVILWRYACYTDMLLFVIMVATFMRLSVHKCAE